MCFLVQYERYVIKKQSLNTKKNILQEVQSQQYQVVITTKAGSW